MELKFKPLVIIAIILLLLPIVLVLIPLFFILNGIVRAGVWTLAKVLRPELDSFVLGERGMFMTEGTTKGSLNICTVGVLKGEVTLEHVRKCTQERILEARDPETGERLYDALEKILEGFMGYAFWKNDPHFDLKKHVRKYDYQDEGLKLPSPCTEQGLKSVLGRLLQVPWDSRRSRWEILVVSNIIGNDGRTWTGLLIRIDHTLADGYSILNIGKLITGSEFSVPKFKLADKKFSMLEKVGLTFKAPYDLLSLFLDAAGTEELRWTEFDEDAPLELSVSPVIRVEDIKSIRKKFGVSYAAVVYSALLGGIQRSLEAIDQMVPEKLATAVILPAIGHPQKGLAVFASTVPVKFTLKAKSSLERLLVLEAELNALGKSAAFLVAPFVGRYLAYFPMSVRKSFLGQYISQQGISMGVSSFPVTTSVEYFDGVEFDTIHCGLANWITSGMFVTTGGVSNKQIFDISINKCVFKSPKAAQIIGQCIAEEIQTLLDDVRRAKSF